MPLSKRAKARRRKHREGEEIRLETLADWIEEHMPSRPTADLADGKKSQEAWELACDLMPLIKRAWSSPSGEGSEP